MDPRDDRPDGPHGRRHPAAGPNEPGQQRRTGSGEPPHSKPQGGQRQENESGRTTFGVGGLKGRLPFGSRGSGGDKADVDPAEAARLAEAKRVARERRREQLAEARRKVGQASKVGAAGVASASRRTAGATGRAGRATGRRIRGLTTAQGAGESGLSRLIELGAVNAAGDTALAVSLAGTVFFAVPSDQARDQVALFLLLTMAPFALMAPLIGPFLDRFRHGRRWAIGATLGLRGFLVWSLAASMTGSVSPWLYPAALGCLVASKAYGVTRASAVPRLLPQSITLVTANSRISLAGVAGATVSAGIAGGLAQIGPAWSLRWAALVYTVGLVLAIRLPSRVDSPQEEEMTGAEGKAARRRAITAAVARAIRCNLGLRFVSGFLTMYLAFLLRDKPIGGLDGAVLAGAVIAAAGIGNSLGTLLGSLLKARKPEAVVLVVLLADATVAILVAIFYGLPMLIALGLVAGLCSSLGKLSLDALIQRDVPETVRTSVFARSETVLQLSWVLGGGCGIVLPLIPRLGFGFLAAVLLIVVFLVVRYRPSTTPVGRPNRDPSGPPPTKPQPTSRTGPPARPAASPTVVNQQPRRRDNGDATTILSTDGRPAERRTDDHWWRDDAPPSPPAAEEDWAKDPTVENQPRTSPFRRRSPGSRPPR
ncbi:MFS transporter [Kribbella sp. NBC_01245]|uniref:MFS transporter n=1 Tax=Kribbella sp. NBC_01245 TaxID=2903578 RepID=UPI002E2D70DC|nr:MFS transporter [Kribbella sp. NBC_01245]